jgi:hypothetical protein
VFEENSPRDGSIAKDNVQEQPEDMPFCSFTFWERWADTVARSKVLHISSMVLFSLYERKKNHKKDKVPL